MLDKATVTFQDTKKAVAILDSRVFGLYTGATAAAMGGNMDLALELAKGLVTLKGAIEFLESTSSLIA